MRAVVYEAPVAVSVKEVAKPVITHPDDIIVKGVHFAYTVVSAHTFRTVTTTCICGKRKSCSSSAAAVLTRIKLEKLLKKGDRVVIPSNVACGHCLNCEEGRSAFCTIVNPGFVPLFP